MIEFIESDQKSKRKIRLFNKLSSNLKVLFHKQMYKFFNDITINTNIDNK